MPILQHAGLCVGFCKVHLPPVLLPYLLISFAPLSRFLFVFVPYNPQQLDSISFITAQIVRNNKSYINRKKWLSQSFNLSYGVSLISTDSAFTWFCGSSPVVPSTIDPKTNGYVPWLISYICNLSLVKLAPIVTKILYSPSFWGHCLL